MASEFEQRKNEHRLGSNECDRYDAEDNLEQVVDIAAECRDVLRQPPVVARSDYEQDDAKGRYEQKKQTPELLHRTLPLLSFDGQAQQRAASDVVIRWRSIHVL